MPARPYLGDVVGPAGRRVAAGSERVVTAVLTAAARAAAYGLLGTVLVLVAVVAMLWPAYGPQGFWTMAWLGVTAVVVTGCGVAWEWLGKRRRKEAERDG